MKDGYFLNKIFMAQKQTKKSGGGLLSFALAAALATAGGYVYATHKDEIDREAKKQIDHLAKMFKESKKDIEKRVKKVWGQVNKDVVKTYLDLRSELLHALDNENLQKQGKMLQEHYNKLVEDVVKNARKAGYLTPEVEKKLNELFKMDWKQVEKMLTKLMNEGSKRAGEVMRKAKVSSKVNAVKKNVMKAAKTAKTSATKAAKNVQKAAKKATPKKKK